MCVAGEGGWGGLRILRSVKLNPPPDRLGWAVEANAPPPRANRTYVRCIPVHAGKGVCWAGHTGWVDHRYRGGRGGEVRGEVNTKNPGRALRPPGVKALAYLAARPRSVALRGAGHLSPLCTGRPVPARSWYTGPLRQAALQRWRRRRPAGPLRSGRLQRQQPPRWHAGLRPTAGGPRPRPGPRLETDPLAQCGGVNPRFGLEGRWSLVGSSSRHGSAVRGQTAGRPASLPTHDPV